MQVLDSAVDPLGLLSGSILLEPNEFDDRVLDATQRLGEESRRA